MRAIFKTGANLSLVYSKTVRGGEKAFGSEKKAKFELFYFFRLSYSFLEG